MSCARTHRVELPAGTVDRRAPQTSRRPLRKRSWFWALLSLAGLLVVLAAMFTSVVPMSADVLRGRIIATLSEKLDSDVTLGALNLRLFPGLRADGFDLTIRRRGAAA